MKTSADLMIGPLVQRHFIAHFAMLECILTHEVERIPIGELRLAQLSKLFWRCMQFELCRDHRFHQHHHLPLPTRIRLPRTQKRINKPNKKAHIERLWLIALHGLDKEHCQLFARDRGVLMLEINKAVLTTEKP